MTGRDPRPEKTRDYRKNSWADHTCQGIVRSELQQSTTGFPMTVTVRCRQTVGVSTWTGSLGQTLRACSRHFGQVELASRPFRADRITLRWDAPRRSLALEMRVAHEEGEH